MLISSSPTFNKRKVKHFSALRMVWIVKFLQSVTKLSFSSSLLSHNTVLVKAQKTSPQLQHLENFEYKYKCHWFHWQ